MGVYAGMTKADVFDSEGRPRLMTNGNMPAILAHYLGEEGRAGSEVSFLEGVGTVAVCVSGWPPAAMARLQERLRRHVATGVDLIVVTSRVALVRAPTAGAK